MCGNFLQRSSRLCGRGYKIPTNVFIEGNKRDRAKDLRSLCIVSYEMASCRGGGQSNVFTNPEDQVSECAWRERERERERERDY